MTVARRLNARFTGDPTSRPMLLVHGFGCDQSMWRHVVPSFEASHHVITIDLVGAGGSDLTAWDRERYSRLEGHAADIVELLTELELDDVVLVGHSVSAMIGALADVMAPGVLSHLVMIGPSPRYVDDDGYRGGFSAEDIDELLESLSANYLGWSVQMAPVIVGNSDRPHLGRELADVFCRMDPEIAQVFARATFLSDVRDVLPQVSVPTLVLQCSEDLIAPDEVGAYVAEHLPRATLRRLRATGHCPNLSAPEETVAVIRDYLRDADLTVPATRRPCP